MITSCLQCSAPYEAATLTGELCPTCEVKLKAAEAEAGYRGAVDANKQRAAVPAAPSPEASRGAIRAKQLRDELAGWATMPPVTRDSGMVQAVMLPKVREYVSLRCGLAVDATMGELCTELGVDRVGLAKLMGPASRAAPVTTPPAPPPAPSSETAQAMRLSQVERGLHELMTRFDTSDTMIGKRDADIESRLASIEAAQQAASREGG